MLSARKTRWEFLVGVLLLSGLVCAQGAADGETLYARHCAGCHGTGGQGSTPLARILDPPPRDLGVGAFRLTTTDNGVPSEADLRKTIERGVPGTSMLGFGHLGGGPVAALVAEVRRLHERAQRGHYRSVAKDAQELESWVRAATHPGPPLSVPDEPADDVGSRRRGALLYQRFCATCHGPDGRGSPRFRGPTTEGVETSPRDFTRGVMKGGSEPGSLFVRIRGGMGGTPMPALTAIECDDAGVWDIVHYLGTLVPSGAQDLGTPMPGVIPVLRVEGPPPEDPDDDRFEGAPESQLVLAPLDRESVILILAVRAVHDGAKVYFRFSWRDSTPTALSPSTANMPDGVGVRITGRAPAYPPSPPTDRVVWLAGMLPRFGGRPAEPTDPESFFQIPGDSWKAGTGSWAHGLWTAMVPVRPRTLRTRGEGLHVSFSLYDGTAGLKAPTGYSPWHRLDLR